MTATRSPDGPDEIDDVRLDRVYARLHDLVSRRRWADFDAALRAVAVETEPPTALLAYLTVSAWGLVRPRLPYRDEFYARVRERFVRERGDETARLLLQGLE